MLNNNPRKDAPGVFSAKYDIVGRAKEKINPNKYRVLVTNKTGKKEIDDVDISRMKRLVLPDDKEEN